VLTGASASADGWCFFGVWSYWNLTASCPLCSFELAELKHGRLAMIGLGGMLHQMLQTKTVSAPPAVGLILKDSQGQIMALAFRSKVFKTV